MVILVTMVYGPIAAFLVELFPARIRYSSMSLPYHIGNGVFGGGVPFIATWLSGMVPGVPLIGLLYPMTIAGIGVIVSTLGLEARNASGPDLGRGRRRRARRRETLDRICALSPRVPE